MLLRAIGLRLRRWGDALLRTSDRPPAPPPSGGPPPDWVERVRRGAPHLLLPGDPVRVAPRPRREIAPVTPLEEPPVPIRTSAVPTPALPEARRPVRIRLDESPLPATPRSRPSETEPSVSKPRRWLSTIEEIPFHPRARRDNASDFKEPRPSRLPAAEAEPTPPLRSASEPPREPTPPSRRLAPFEPSLMSNSPSPSRLPEMSAVDAAVVEIPYLSESAAPPLRAPLPEASWNPVERSVTAAVGAGEADPRGDPWPRLPPAPEPDPIEEADAAHRERERRARLEREQEGGAWSA